MKLRTLYTFNTIRTKIIELINKKQYGGQDSTDSYRGL